MGNINIERLKMEQIEAAATRIEEILEAATNSGFSLKEKYSFLLRVQPGAQHLFQKVEYMMNKTDIDTLPQSEKMNFLGFVYRVMHLAKRYDKEVERTRTLLELSGCPTDGDTAPGESLNQRTPRKAGRPKARTDLHLSDLLINCDGAKVVEAIKADPHREPRPKYYYCLVAALVEAGKLNRESIIIKELFYALKNDFGEIGGFDSLEDNLANPKETADRYRTTVENIKKAIL